MCIRRTLTRGLIDGTKGKRLVRSSVQTPGRSCVGVLIMERGADSRFGANYWVDTQPEIVKDARSGTRFVSMGHRIAEGIMALPSGPSEDLQSMGRSSDAPRAQSIVDPHLGQMEEP